MSFADFYVHKAEDCDRLAAAATDERRRLDLREEGRLWREIARNIVRQDRAEGGPP
jgi:hypothetical protein